MQPNIGEKQAMRTRMNGSSKSSKSPSSTISSQLPISDLQFNNPHPLIQNRLLHRPDEDDDFFNQMLYTIPSWPDLPKPHWNLSASAGNKPVAGEEGPPFAKAPFDASSLLTARFQQQQISTHQQHPQQHQLLLSAMAGSHQSPTNASASDSGLFPTLPLSLGASIPGADSNSSFKLPNSTGVGFSYSQAQHSHQSQGGPMHQPNFRGSPPTSPAIISGGGGGGAAAGTVPRQRVRARRGQATDPHSIAERLRRERIAERMKALQELVPNANKTDKASMLDEIIDYVKFLQLQVKVLSMSRLGGAAAVTPLIADISSEGSPASASEAMSVVENLVAKLMEEDMGSTMQYLQAKGLCLMPISLASAISPSAAGGLSAVGRLIVAGEDVPPPPPSPSMSVLTVQSRSSDKDPA